ncbi:MAG: AlpA family phage regulatory protein [Burkholderiales bacterium]|nr:AlpA family phage regulatory protein [Burkholderiales bacterium]
MRCSSSARRVVQLQASIPTSSQPRHLRAWVLVIPFLSHRHRSPTAVGRNRALADRANRVHYLKDGIVKTEATLQRRIRLPIVLDRVGLKRSAIYKRIAAKTFPAPMKDGGASLWLERDIEAYIAGTWRAPQL